MTQYEFSRFTAPGVEMVLREDYAEDLLDLNVADAESLAARPDASVMAGRGPLVCVGLPGRPGERIVIRHYRHGGLLRAFTRDLFLGRERFLRELDLTCEALALGVPTLDVLGLVIRRAFPGVYRADLITREVSNTMDLMRYLSLYPRPGRRQVVHAAARAVRAMHDAGILHADLNLKNILIGGGCGGGVQAFVIDLDKSRRLDRLSEAERLWNLARLNRSVEKLNRRRVVVSRADRLRFFRAYAGGDSAIEEQFANWQFDLWTRKRWWGLLERVRGRENRGMAAAESILVKAPNWLGDAVMALPAVRSLKRSCPTARICVLTKANLADFYREMPEVDFVLEYGAEADLLALAPVLRRWKFDAAVILPRSFRSALLAWLARIPLRAGYVSGFRGPLLTDRFERNRAVLNTHRVHYYQNIVRGLGLTLEPTEDGIRYEPGPAATERAAELLCGAGGGAPRVALHPGAAYGGAKQWMPERFVEVARLLIEKQGAAVVVLGAGEGEVRLAEKIVEAVGAGAVSLAGKTSIRELAAVLQASDLLITNDTGPMHLGAAVGTRVVSIFGPTDPVTTAPFGPGQTVVREGVECSPCLKRECPTDHRCMTRIDVNRVFAAAVERLSARAARHGDGSTMPERGASA